MQAEEMAGLLKNLKDERKDLVPLLDTIVEKIPQPKVEEGSLQMQVTIS